MIALLETSRCARGLLRLNNVLMKPKKDRIQAAKLPHEQSQVEKRGGIHQAV